VTGMAVWRSGPRSGVASRIGFAAACGLVFGLILAGTSHLFPFGIVGPTRLGVLVGAAISLALARVWPGMWFRRKPPAGADGRARDVR
jgi:hypothetical protein